MKVLIYLVLLCLVISSRAAVSCGVANGAEGAAPADCTCGAESCKKGEKCAVDSGGTGTCTDYSEACTDAEAGQTSCKCAGDPAVNCLPGEKCKEGSGTGVAGLCTPPTDICVFIQDFVGNTGPAPCLCKKTGIGDVYDSTCIYGQLCKSGYANTSGICRFQTCPETGGKPNNFACLCPGDGAGAATLCKQYEKCTAGSGGGAGQCAPPDDCAKQDGTTANSAEACTCPLGTGGSGATAVCKPGQTCAPTTTGADSKCEDADCTNKTTALDVFCTCKKVDQGVDVPCAVGEKCSSSAGKDPSCALDACATGNDPQAADCLCPASTGGSGGGTTSVCAAGSVCAGVDDAPATCLFTLCAKDDGSTAETKKCLCAAESPHFSALCDVDQACTKGDSSKDAVCAYLACDYTKGTEAQPKPCTCGLASGTGSADTCKKGEVCTQGTDGTPTNSSCDFPPPCEAGANGQPKQCKCDPTSGDGAFAICQAGYKCVPGTSGGTANSDCPGVVCAGAAAQDYACVCKKTGTGTAKDATCEAGQKCTAGSGDTPAGDSKCEFDPCVAGTAAQAAKCKCAANGKGSDQDCKIGDKCTVGTASAEPKCEEVACSGTEPQVAACLCKITGGTGKNLLCKIGDICTPGVASGGSADSACAPPPCEDNTDPQKRLCRCPKHAGSGGKDDDCKVGQKCTKGDANTNDADCAYPDCTKPYAPAASVCHCPKGAGTSGKDCQPGETCAEGTSGKAAECTAPAPCSNQDGKSNAAICTCPEAGGSDTGASAVCQPHQKCTKASGSTNAKCDDQDDCGEEDGTKNDASCYCQNGSGKGVNCAAGSGCTLDTDGNGSCVACTNLKLDGKTCVESCVKAYSDAQVLADASQTAGAVCKCTDKWYVKSDQSGCAEKCAATKEATGTTAPLTCTDCAKESKNINFAGDACVAACDKGGVASGGAGEQCKCAALKDGNVFTSAAGTCGKKCPTGEGAGSDKMCAKCPTLVKLDGSCGTACITGATKGADSHCKCDSGKVYEGGACTDKCGTDKFKTTTAKCVAKCSDEGEYLPSKTATDCTASVCTKYQLNDSTKGIICMDACESTEGISLDGKTCTATCPTGSTKDATTKRCQCDAATPFIDADKAKCVASDKCKTGYAPKDGLCQKCSGSLTDCEECTTHSLCTKCGNSKFLEGGKCVASCASGSGEVSGACLVGCGAGQYLDGTACKSCTILSGSSAIADCTDCGDGTNNALCTACSGTKVPAADGKTCTDDCATGKKEFKGTCLDACPKRTFDKSGQCTDCSSDCAECTSDTECTKCDPFFYLVDKKCATSCGAGKFVHNDACVTACPDGTGSTGVMCLACSVADCATCPDSPMVCKTCKTDFTLAANACTKKSGDTSDSSDSSDTSDTSDTTDTGDSATITTFALSLFFALISLAFLA